MATTQTVTGAVQPLESASSAMQWGPIMGGAFAAAGVSTALLLLGAGVGLASGSPFYGQGPSPAAFGVGAAIWLIVIHWAASATGGYIAGRTRVRWVGIHDDEVFFRDTAHGFVTWAVATVIAAAVVGLTAGSIAAGVARTAGGLAEAATQGATQGAAQGAVQNGSPLDPTAYIGDFLFRAQPGAATPGAAGATPARDPRAEATRIIASGIASGDVPAADRTYLAQLVSAQTGLAQPEAEARVNNAINQAKAAADKAKAAADSARKAAASVAFFTAFAMIIGAFIASVAAALGGKLRDEPSLVRSP